MTLTQGDYEYKAVKYGSDEQRALLGSGHGDTFAPNPEGWQINAVVGPVAVMIRRLTVTRAAA